MLVAQYTPDVLGVMETWLTDDIKKADGAIPGYFMLGRDHTIWARGCGVIIFIVSMYIYSMLGSLHLLRALRPFGVTSTSMARPNY